MSSLEWSPDELRFVKSGANKAKIGSTADDVIYIEGVAASSTCMLTGLTECTSDEDAANKKYVDDEIAKIVLGSGFLDTSSTSQSKSGKLDITNGTNSSSTSTGAFVVTGGVGIGKNIHCGGSITAISYITGSDKRLKYDIKDIPDSLDTLKQITPKSYKLIKTGETKNGFIAQDLVESGLEYLVSKQAGEDAMMSVDYNSIVGLLVGAVKSLTKEVEDLKEKVRALE